VRLALLPPVTSRGQVQRRVVHAQPAPAANRREGGFGFLGARARVSFRVAAPGLLRFARVPAGSLKPQLPTLSRTLPVAFAPRDVAQMPPRP